MNLNDEGWRYADYLLASDFGAVFAALGVDPAATEWQGYLGLMRVGLDASTGLSCTFRDAKAPAVPKPRC